MESVKIIPKKILIPFILITSCFAWWGLANNMTDTLLAAFKRIMSLSDFKTSWIQVAFYGSYFCLAIPAALFIRRFSYKSGVLLGLGLFIFGSLLFYPASKSMSYTNFLIALYILAGGLSILETSANPYVFSMGAGETGTMRLNFAQSFNPIGSIVGIGISKYFILANLDRAGSSERATMSADQLASIQTKELDAVMGPYVGIAFVLIVIWLLIFFTKMPYASDDEKMTPLGNSVRKLLRNKNYFWGVVAQFFYVGAQIGVWSFTIRYVMQELNMNEAEAASYYLASLILFAVSRFICTGLMKFLAPRKLLTILSVLAILLCIIVMFAGGLVGAVALVGISGCMSLMFPTIFGLAIFGLGEETKIAGSGLIMAILGGALLTMVQGQVSDLTSINFSYIIPMICFVVISLYGFAAKGSLERQ